MKVLLATLTLMLATGCATITSDPMVPIMLSFSDGSDGECTLSNKRGVWSTEIPATASVRRSDDPVKFVCETDDGREAIGGIPSRVGAKIVASAVFIDFGITDAITDMHREYPVSVVLPVSATAGKGVSREELAESPLNVSDTKREKVLAVAESMQCNDSISLAERSEERDVWSLSCGDGETLNVMCYGEDCYVRNN